ncbi:hypothetical protein LXA43DRAFT_920064 [Ganoderma leucocontextum]|nr:hypothetical protein LXA43DRAFT_920064 [Ganoderma leucocontextum]
MSLRAPPLAQLSPQPRAITPESAAAAQPQGSPRPTTTTTVATNNPQAPAESRSAFQRAKHRLKELLGYAGSRQAQRDRQEIVRLVALLGYSGVQIIIIIVIIIIGAKTTSPLPLNADRNPPVSQSELSACSLLGAWILIWLGKLIIWGYLEIWVLRYKRRLRRARQAAQRQQRASRADLPPLEFPHGAEQPGPDGGNAVPEEGEPLADGPREHHELCPLTWASVHLLVYKLDFLVSLIWYFVTVLIATEEGSRCREGAKDIRAGSFTILFMVYCHYTLTVLLPAIQVLMARHRAAQPLIGKLSKKDVDRIPLVLFIPPPPADTPASPISPLPRSVTHPIPSPRPPPPPPSKRRRFISFRPTFRRRDTRPGIADIERGAEAMSPIDEEGDDWDRIWERGSYPFVRLPENRATCIICLTDFEAPRRVSERERATQPTMIPEGNGLEMRPLSSLDPALGVEEVRVEAPRDADARTIELADTGGSDAPQPLRLLSCGHVYHKECVDPWLIQNSGRCPYCSARVEIPPAPERRKSIWRRGIV